MGAVTAPVYSEKINVRLPDGLDTYVPTFREYVVLPTLPYVL